MEPNNDNPQTPTEQPQTPTSDVSQPTSSTEASVNSNATSKKLFGKIGIVPTIIIAAIVLIGGSAAAYLGLVLPNQPENIWKTALENTSKGYDRLIEYSEDLKETKGGHLKGNFKVDGPEIVADGNIEGRFDNKNANFSLDAGAAGTRLKFNILTNIPEGASTPDIYLKAEGLDGLASLLGGDPSTEQMLASINNQYYFIDHTMLEQYQKQLTSSSTPDVDEIKTEDVIDFLKQLGDVNNEYIFTADAGKAVFVVKEEIGKETVDSRETYHFKVAIDKDNIKAWNQAVCDRLVNHKIMKALSGKENDEERKKECEDTSDYDSIDENQTADAWVDMKTKLIRTIRITEKDGKSSYDFGLLYDGGDEYPFYISMKDEEQGDMLFKAVLNTKANTVQFVVDAAIKSDTETANVDVDLMYTPSNDAVEFTKPEGAKSLSELLAPFLGMFSGQTQPTSIDTTLE